MRQFIYRFFRKFAKLFSGHGLRDRYRVINRIYKKLNQGLSPHIAKIHGHIMHLDMDDSMGLSIHGEYEPVETKLINKFIQPGSAVLDIGANIGYFTLLFAKIVGPSGHVYAFEPDPYSFGLLDKNIKENKYNNISIYQLAVSDKAATYFLHRDQFNNLDHRVNQLPKFDSSIPVDVIRLDDFLPLKSDQDINFIKMDIQGSEGWALEGMKDLISISKNISILTEYWPMGLDQSGYGKIKFLQELETLGFRFIDLESPENDRSSISIEDILHKYPEGYSGHTNIFCQRN